MSLIGLTVDADLHYASQEQQQALHDVLWKDGELHPLIEDMLVQQSVQFMQTLLEDATLTYRAEATILRDEDDDEPYEHIKLDTQVIMDREKDSVAMLLEHEDTADQLEDLVLQVIRDHLPRSAFEEGLEVEVEVAGLGYA